MATSLKILYRGPLSSCNYDCPYCPFGKHRETAEELKVDKQCLEKFVTWVSQCVDRSIGILFTPWGEALTRRWYQIAMVQLSQFEHVQRVAVQTNLSARLEWLQDADRESLALWCTYHPGEVSRESFLDRCRELDAMQIRYSVGVVGLNEHEQEIEALRRELNPDTYLWINAYKRKPDYYDADTIEAFTKIDALFPINNQRHASLEKLCRTGESVISVDGDGTVRRCHFIKQELGNLYKDDLSEILRTRACTNETCGCHIGYVHMPHLGMDDEFGENVLERIPKVYASRNQVD
jgi:MoaA/NifB/PqqE/SkfB family radical SAM enzyme